MSPFLPPTELRWLFLDLNSYFASVEQNENPSLRHRPVAVLPLQSEHTCVIAASYEAKAFGIKTGTPVREARQRCPGLVCVAGRHDKYVEYHHRILAEIDRHIPVSRICSIDEVACELDPAERAPEAATALATRIKAGLRANIGPCIRCSIGLAPSRLLAKIGTNLQKPDGLVVLEPHTLEEKLFPLALTDLPGISRGVSTRLGLGGVTTMEAFWKITPHHARALWGSVQGERFWYALHGYDFPELETERSSVSHSQVLAPEVRPWSEARLVGRRLMQKTASRLRRMNLYAQRAGLSVHTLDERRWHGEVAIEATDDNFTMLHAFEQLWLEAGRALRAPQLRKVGVWLSHVLAPEAVQPDLFAQPVAQHIQQKHAELSAVMDKLNKRFGRDTVLLGMPARQMANYTGTKVAFTRIPDEEEFHE